MSNTPKSPGIMLDGLRTLSKGLQSGVLPKDCTQITADGKVTSIADLTTEVAAMQKIYEDEVAAARAHADALKVRDEAAPGIAKRHAAIAQALKIALGKHSAHLAALGLAPDKVPTALTVQQLQERVQKGLATRKARHTVGKKQRKAIKGTVPTPSPAPTPSR